MGVRDVERMGCGAKDTTRGAFTMFTELLQTPKGGAGDNHIRNLLSMLQDHGDYDLVRDSAGGQVALGG